MGHTPALHSAEIVEANSNSAEVEMETTPALPSSHTATPLHTRNDEAEEAAAQRHACRERDARQSLALSDPDVPSIKSLAGGDYAGW